MTPWQIRVSSEARSFLHKLRDEKLKRRISQKIDMLTNDPRPVGCKKLAGSESIWRVRVSDYRIIYEIQDSQLIVLVVNIDHRRDIYR